MFYCFPNVFFKVVALYPFQAIESGDISLEKVCHLLLVIVNHCVFRVFLLTKKKSFPSLQGEEYEVVDDSQEHWWKVRDKFGYFLAPFFYN